MLNNVCEEIVYVIIRTMMLWHFFLGMHEILVTFIYLFIKLASIMEMFYMFIAIEF